jgi:hypothetical protein
MRATIGESPARIHSALRGEVEKTVSGGAGDLGRVEKPVVSEAGQRFRRTMKSWAEAIGGVFVLIAIASLVGLPNYEKRKNAKEIEERIQAMQPLAARSFGSFDCTDECQGHRAGFRWAEEHSITSDDDCPRGRSLSFTEGCEVYVEQPSRDADLDDDGDSLD